MSARAALFRASSPAKASSKASLVPCNSSIDCQDFYATRTHNDPPPHLPTDTEQMATIMADQEVYGDLAPKFAPFLGMAGIAFAMIFGCREARIGKR